MAANTKKKTSALTVVVLIAIALVKYCTPDKKPAQDQPAATAEKPPVEQTAPAASPKPATRNVGGWTAHSGATLVTGRNNDGDSFLAKLPNGKTQEFRLYFVDTPESEFKRYRDGNTNATRIAQQAQYFGNITPEAATAVGKEAKAFTLKLLASSSFELFTRDEEVYDSGRYYCHVRVNHAGKSRWLDEVLVEKGYVRIITQPADLPDGTKAESHRKHLRSLEAIAKKNKLGAWK